MVTIAHATALTDEDMLPFRHGLALAAAGSGRLVSVHAGQSDEALAKMPDAASLLERWGVNATHEPLIHECCDDPVDTLLDGLKGLAPDLVVAATHQREGVVRLLIDSRAEAIAENIDAPTLLLPIGTRGFVDALGVIDLQRILVPISDAKAGQTAIAEAMAFAKLAGVTDVECELLFVGNREQRPKLELPELPNGWRFIETTAHGSIEDAIVDAATNACIIVMATRGHDSVKDVILGSHTERVLHRSPCAVLSVHVP